MRNLTIIFGAFAAVSTAALLYAIHQQEKLRDQILFLREDFDEMGEEFKELIGELVTTMAYMRIRMDAIAPVMIDYKKLPN